jgi:hypothetical protein
VRTHGQPLVAASPRTNFSLGLAGRRGKPGQKLRLNGRLGSEWSWKAVEVDARGRGKPPTGQILVQASEWFPSGRAGRYGRGGFARGIYAGPEGLMEERVHLSGSDASAVIEPPVEEGEEGAGAAVS